MAGDEFGKITFEVEVDSSDAEAGFDRIGNSLDGVSKDAAAFEAKAGNALDHVGKSALSSGSDVQSSSGKSSAALQNLANNATNAGSTTSSALGKIGDSSNESFEGLDRLKDNSGELASSMGGLAGAIGVVNPQLGSMVSSMGALSGGAEGGAKLVKQLKTGLAGLASPTGLAIAGFSALAGGIAWMAFRSRGAAVDLEKMGDAVKNAGKVASSLEDLQLELRVERGEITQVEADLESLDRRVRSEFRDSMVSIAAPIGDAMKSAQEKVSGLKETMAFWQAKDQTPQVAANVSRFKDRIKEATDEMNKLLAGTEAGRQLTESIGNLDQIVGLRRDLIILQDQGAKGNDLDRIASEKAAKAAAWRAAQERKRAKAEQDRLAQRAADMKMLGLLAGEHEVAFQSMIAESNALFEEGNINAVELAALVTEAHRQRTTAIETAGEAERAVFDSIDVLTASNVMAQKSATDQILADKKAAFDELEMLQNNQEDLLGDQMFRRMTWIRAQLADEVISQVDADAQIEAAKEEHESKLTELARAGGDAREAMEDDFRARQGEADVEALATAEGVMQERAAKMQAIVGQFTGMVSAFTDLQRQDLEQARASFVAAAGDDMEKAAKLEEEFNEAHRGEMERMWKADKAGKIAGTIAAGAQAVMQTWAQLGPAGAAIMAPIVAATTAAQVALIQGQAPTFHDGGMIGGRGGNVPITAQGGEAVLNRQAVARIGGPAAVEGLNSTQGGGGGGGPMTVNLTYRGKAFDSVVIDSLRKNGGPLRSALNKAQKRGRRGRVGGLL